jgi:hypothetical protein
MGYFLEKSCHPCVLWAAHCLGNPLRACPQTLLGRAGRQPCSQHDVERRSAFSTKGQCACRLTIPVAAELQMTTDKHRTGSWVKKLMTEHAASSRTRSGRDDGNVTVFGKNAIR